MKSSTGLPKAAGALSLYSLLHGWSLRGWQTFLRRGANDPAHYQLDYRPHVQRRKRLGPMTKSFRVNDTDLMRACSYIAEDKAIADYFHVDIERVTALRAKVSNKDTVQAERAQNRKPMPATAEDQRLRRQAKQGSDDLLRALMKFFERRAILQNPIARQDVTT